MNFKDCEQLKNLRNIYQHQIMMPIKIEKKDNFILYFNFKQDENNFCEMISKIILNKQSNGFISFIELSKYLIYFSGFFQKEYNVEINYQELTRIKIFCQHFISQVSVKQIQIILQFPLEFYTKEINQLTNKQIMNHFIYSIFDGQFPEKSNSILSLFVSSQYDHIIGCSFNQTFINCQNPLFDCKYELNEHLTKQLFFEMILKKVRSFKKSFKSPHLFKNIGYICQMYLSNQLQLIYDEFGKQLKLLEKDLFILLQLPINIINMQQEISHKEKQFQENLYIILIKIKQILFQYIDNFENLSTQIYNVINEWQNNITNSLIEIKNDNLQIKEFLNNLTKENIKFNNNSQYFQYDFLLSKADIIVYNYFQNYNDKQKLISDLNQFDLLIISWLDCFKDNIVSSIAYLFKLDLLPQEQEQKKNQTSVFILGPTRVGKSTLLNIINNSLNMKIHETQHKSLVFDVKEVSEKFEISHGLNSLTDCLQYFQLKNTNLLFFDSPGFVDTQYEKRIINQIKIFLKLIIQNQVILMILIDGLELCVSKKNFSETIKLLNIFFGDDSFDKQNYLSIIIPVFTKLEENTMDVIKKKWDSEIMKNIQNNAEENMLKIIKNQIDKNRHIKIYQASHYQNNNLQDLKSKKKEKETEMMELIKLQQFEQFQEFGINIKNLQNQIDYLENNRNEIIYKVKFEEIQQLRNRIIDICQELKDEQIEKQIQIKFSLKLTADLQNHLDQVLILWKNIFQFILKNIENSLLNMTQTHFNFRTFLTSLDVLERNLQYFQKENRDQRLYRYYYFFFKFCIYTNNNLIIQDCFRLLYLVDIFDQLSGKKQYCYDIDSLLNHIYQQVIYLKKGFNKQLFNFDQIDMAKNQQIFKEFQNNYSSKK